MKTCPNCDLDFEPKPLTLDIQSKTFGRLRLHVDVHVKSEQLDTGEITPIEACQDCTISLMNELYKKYTE